jgi:hypothetical protein
MERIRHIMLFATANGGRTDGKEQDNAQTGTKACSKAPRPRAIEVGCSEQPDVSKLTTNLRSCIHRMVPFRTQARLQQDCSYPVPNLPRTAALRFNHDQLALAAIRRLAYEAADCGLLSADLAAGIRRVKVRNG